MKKLLIVALLLTILSGCDNSVDSDKKIIYTTNYAQKYILNSIGQQYVEAYSIYDNRDEYNPDNEEAYEYNVLTPSSFTFEDYDDKLTSVLNADLFIYNGHSDNDVRVLKELVNADKDEDVMIFDTTENAKRSFVETNLALSYDGQAIDNGILDLLKTDSEMEMYWLSPIEMMNVSTEIYHKLIEVLPNHEEELKDNYDNLMYDLNSLYATIEDIRSSNINNIVVSDSVHLNILDIHYIENVYTDYQNNSKYKNDENADAYLAEINTYLTVDDSKIVSTTNTESNFYFDLMEVQSNSNYQEGLTYYDMMLNNFEILEQALQ